MLPKTVLYELRCFLVERKVGFYSVPPPPNFCYCGIVIGVEV